MRTRPIPASLVLAALLPAAAATAQTYDVLPSGNGYDKQAGENSVVSGSADAWSRNLQVVHRDRMGGQAFKILEVAYRPRPDVGSDAHTRTLTMRMGITQETPDDLPLHFSLIKVQLVDVFQGTLNLPSFTANSQNPGAWSFVVKLTKPFVWTWIQGNFVLDLESTSSSSSAQWHRDARLVKYSAVPGTYQVLGPGCKGTGGSTMGHYPYPDSRAVPGSVMTVKVNGAQPTSQYAWHVLGATTSTPYPIDLGPIGLTGCKLYTSLELMQFVPLGQAGTGPRSGLAYWPVPASSQLVGARLGSQWFELDLGANPLGLTFSDGLRITLGTPGTRKYQTQCTWGWTKGQDLGSQSTWEYGSIFRITR